MLTLGFAPVIMAYSTEAERKELEAEIFGRIRFVEIFYRSAAWEHTRTRRGYPSPVSLFDALTWWVLFELKRGLSHDSGGYHNYILVRVWDAWTGTRRVGDVDFLAAIGRSSEQVKVVLTEVNKNLVRLELKRNRDGRSGCFYRVEGGIFAPEDGGHQVVSFA